MGRGCLKKSLPVGILPKNPMKNCLKIGKIVLAFPVRFCYNNKRTFFERSERDEG